METSEITILNIAKLTGDYEKETAVGRLAFQINFVALLIWAAIFFVFPLDSKKFNDLFDFFASLFFVAFFFFGVNKHFFKFFGQRSKKCKIRFINHQISDLEDAEQSLRKESKSEIRKRVKDEICDNMTEMYRQTLDKALEEEQAMHFTDLVDTTLIGYLQKEIIAKFEIALADREKTLAEIASEVIRLRELIVAIEM